MSILGSIIGAGMGAAGNLLGSASQSAMGYYMSKKMAKYNYDLQKQGYQEFPTAQVEGLRAAGINPMVAYGGIAGAQAHAGNYQAAPGSDLGSSAVNNYRENKKLNPALQNMQADTESKKAQAEASMAQAGAASDQGKAALINAKTNAKRVDAEISLMQSRDPNLSNWGVFDKILSYAGDIGTTVGGTAIGAKAIYDLLKKDKLKIINTTDQFGVPKTFIEHPGGVVTPTNVTPNKPSALSRFKSKFINSAKEAWPLLLSIGKGAGLIGLGGYIGYEGHKRTNHEENEKMKSNGGWYPHGNWSR